VGHSFRGKHKNSYFNSTSILEMPPLCRLQPAAGNILFSPAPAKCLKIPFHHHFFCFLFLVFSSFLRFTRCSSPPAFKHIDQHCTISNQKPSIPLFVFQNRMPSTSPIYAVILLPAAQPPTYGGNYSYLLRSSETNMEPVASASPPFRISHLSAILLLDCFHRLMQVAQSSPFSTRICSRDQFPFYRPSINSQQSKI
jgi:hypothetical protein